jgi:hypothetical protein
LDSVNGKEKEHAQRVTQANFEEKSKSQATTIIFELID